MSRSQTDKHTHTAPHTRTPPPRLILARRACGAGLNLSGRLAQRRDSRYGPRRGRTQQAGAAPHGLGADAPQEDHYSGMLCLTLQRGHHLQ